MPYPFSARNNQIFEEGYNFGQKLRETIAFLEQAKNVDELYVRTALIPVEDYTTIIVDHRPYTYVQGNWIPKILSYDSNVTVKKED